MKTFCLVLIRPSHYDDDGYVIQWHRLPIPSNSLAAVYGLVLDCAKRRVLGSDWTIETHTLDETHSVVRAEELAGLVEKADAGLVMLIGVQSNQFPRALDIARPLRERGIQVAIGGFHVSGAIAMLDGRDRDLDEARALGVSLFAGEAEGRLEEVLDDARRGVLKRLYNYVPDLPVISNAPTPFMPAGYAARSVFKMATVDAGRGCPYQCSFCTIINVQGRVSRRRSPDDVEKIVRDNLAQGVHSFFITDDNFARNKDWEAIVDRLIAMREAEKLRFGFRIQVDTLCHRIPNFIEKCARAGIGTVFIGLENINPANLVEAKKRQNKITEYRQMLLAWKASSVVTIAGYITGFSADTHDSVMEDIEVIKRELPVDILEFFYLTPLPGSEDHQRLRKAGVEMDADLNKYDLNHVTTGHAKMPAKEWERTYRDAWSRYYTADHAETIFRRAVVSGTPPGKLLVLMVWFYGGLRIEGVHPLECGILRRKDRRQRRPGRPIEPALLFYPKYYASTAIKLARWVWTYLRFGRLLKKAERDPKRHSYTDRAMTRDTGHEEDRALFQSEEAQAYLDQEKRLAKARRGELRT